MNTPITVGRRDRVHLESQGANEHGVLVFDLMKPEQGRDLLVARVPVYATDDGYEIGRFEGYQTSAWRPVADVPSKVRSLLSVERFRQLTARPKLTTASARTSRTSAL